MLKRLADIFAPHYCCSCGEIGEILCENCKYDITLDAYVQCLVCQQPTSDSTALCRNCIMPYSRAWCVGERDNTLKNLLSAYKFERARAGVGAIVALLDASIPYLPFTTTITGVPTLYSHRRRRGYDHTELIAKAFAKQRHLAYRPILEHQGDGRQLHASKIKRLDQAKHAYRAKEAAAGTILLIDDVFTTGSTIFYASQALLDAGASEVYVAVLARQPLEKDR